MAKKPIQNLDLDSMADDAELVVPVVVRQAAPPPPAEIKTILIEVPTIEVRAEQYRPRHLDVQLNAQEADAMKRLLGGLDQRGDRLANGRRVQTAADAVRWLLEQVGK